MLENEILNNELNLNDNDIIVKQFTSIITEAVHKAIGKTILDAETILIPWQSNQCRNAIKKL